MERVAWAFLAVLIALISYEAFTSGLNDRLLRGDQASHVFQAISLADMPPNLTFDERDFAKWESMEWTPGPDGLIFHENGDDITAAKPYGYSLVAAPFVGVLGPVDGMGAANVALFLFNVGVIGWLLAIRYRSFVLPLAIGAFAIASTLYLNIYVMQPELFMSALVGVVCITSIEGVRRDSTILTILTFVAAAWLVSERLPLVVLLVPPLLWILVNTPSPRRRALFVAVGALSLLVAVIPYLSTTGGSSYTAYGGDRFYLYPGADAWPPDGSLVVAVETGQYFGADHIFGQLHPDNWGNIGRAVMYTVVGRNTGMLVFLPMALLSFVAVFVGRPWQRIRSQQFAWIVGVLLYLGFHAVLLTSTFWGGGQTLGNKYVLHALPAFVAVLALSEVSRRVVAVAAAAAIVIAIAGMGPKLWNPSDSLWAVWQNTQLQDVLPYEYFALDPNIYPPQGDG